jgi:hypothetical protein
LAGVAAMLSAWVVASPADAAAVRTWDGTLLGNHLWSDATNWDNDQPIAMGDYLEFQGGGGDLINDLTNFSATRVTLGGQYGYNLKGNPLTLTESLIVEEGGGEYSVELNLLGKADTLLGEGTTLTLSGNNTFNGQVDTRGRLIVGSNTALGSVAGPTKVNYPGQLRLADRDLSEPIQIAGADGEYECALEGTSGTSILRDVTLAGRTCFDGATLSFPNGIKESTAGFDLLLTFGTFMFGGTTNAAGPLRLQRQVDLYWNSNAAVAIASEAQGPVEPSGNLYGSGTAASLDFRGGTFAPGNGAATGRFSLTGAAKLRNATLNLLLNSTTAGTGYSQVQAGGPVTIGADTALQLTLGFIPTTGQQFRIIDNTGSSAISGTFDGLPEGATFFRSGRPFSITYKGGSGNDVVVTALAPDPRPYKRVLMMLAAGG